MNLILFTATGHAGMERGCAHFRGVARVVAHYVAFHARVCVGSSGISVHIAIFPHVPMGLRSGNGWSLLLLNCRQSERLLGDMVGHLDMVVGGKVGAASAALTTLLVEVVLEMLPPPALFSLSALPLIW